MGVGILMKISVWLITLIFLISPASMGAGSYIGFFPVVLGTYSNSINVALASNGGVASASSTTSGFAPSGTINGDRNGINWGTSGGWNDSTASTFPDWLEVDFNATYNIAEIDVFTVQDAFGSPSTPTLSMTCSNYCIRDFEVQYWNGSAWTDVTGGNVTFNNKVWRQFTFTAISTNKIRIQVNASNGSGDYSRLTEVEAWTQ